MRLEQRRIDRELQTIQHNVQVLQRADPWTLGGADGGTGRGRDANSQQPSGPVGGTIGGHDAAYSAPRHPYACGNHGNHGNYDGYNTNSGYPGHDGYHANNGYSSDNIPQLPRLNPNYRLFDDKVPTQDGYSYDGIHSGALWRIKIRNYWIPKCAGIKSMLDWAEGRGLEEITMEQCQQQSGIWGCEQQGVSWQTVVGAMWGFLGQCLTGAAFEAHEIVEELNGLEAWRSINRIIDHGKPQQNEQIRQRLKNLPPIKSLDGIAAGAVKYEKLVREYVSTGGDKPSESIMKNELLDMLPSEMREHLLWHATSPTFSYPAFRNHVVTQAASILGHRGRLPVHQVTHQVTQQDNGDISKILANSDNSDNPAGMVAQLEDILAMARKGGFRPGGQGGRREDVRCYNCGARGHTANQCKEPPRPKDKQPCFECGGFGHIARECPFKKDRNNGGGRQGPPGRKTINNVNAGERREPDFFGCVSYKCHGCKDREEDDGFQAITRRGRTTPAKATLAEFIRPTSISHAFKALRDDDDCSENSGASMRMTDKIDFGGQQHKTANEFNSSTSQVNQRQKQATTKTISAVRNKGPLEWSHTCPGCDFTWTGQATTTTCPLCGTWRDTTSRLKPDSNSPHDQPSTGNFTTCRSKHPTSTNDDVHDNDLGVIDYADPNGQILNTEMETTMYVALDTGAVEHVANAKHLPNDVMVERTAKSEACGFVAADGSPMTNYGEACVTTTGEEENECDTIFNVTDVTRPLHAACKIADQNNEILIMQGKSVVVPAGTFSRYLKQAKVKATYHRKGGLYISKMRARAAAPRQPPNSNPKTSAGFMRRGR